MSKIVGTVVFVKDNKTAKVKVNRIIEHPVYKKRIKTYNNFACQISANCVVKIGDLVEIHSCKPVSKTKSFEILQVIKKAE